MTINEAMRTYRLPNPTTPEDLECRWSKILNFGDKVLLAGYYWGGKGKPSYFGAPQPARLNFPTTATQSLGRCSSKEGGAMMNKNNTYFEELKRIGHEWEAARIELKARKQQIIDTLGWESDELKAWYEEDAAAKFPFEQGVSKAYRAWATSISRKEDELEMDDFLWEREVTDFVETLRKAGIKTFVYTNQSTAVMENLHQFAAAGCTMEGLCTITRQENRWGDEEPTKVMGIRFSLD